MASHFSSLGFDVANVDDLGRLVKQVMALADPVVRADGGKTYIFGTMFKASLAVHADADGTVSCVEPFLSPDSRHRAVFRDVLPNDETVHYSVVLADFEAGGGHVMQLGFVTPHLLAWSEALTPGTAIEVGVAGVAESVELVEADSPLQIVSLGLRNVPADPCVHVTGRVVAHFLRFNELGKRPFEWATVDAGVTRLEIVADSDMLSVPFRSGRVISGEFRLTGPIWGEA